MNQILILFAHPRFEASRTNKVLVQHVQGMTGVTFHDLYEQYPEFHINIDFEKELLEQHEVIIWHHPLYWYSCPPLLKQWIDLVLEFGWAYGRDGDALQGKQCLSVITTGGSREVYCREGSNVYSISEFLRPFEQTAKLCGMTYLPPFAVTGTHNISEQELAHYGRQYAQLIQLLQESTSFEMGERNDFLNDAPALKNRNL